MSAEVIFRPGLLDRLQRLSGLSNESFAAAIGTDTAVLEKVRNGQAPSLAMIAGVASAFSMALGEIAQLSSDEAVAA